MVIFSLQKMVKFSLIVMVHFQAKQVSLCQRRVVSSPPSPRSQNQPSLPWKAYLYLEVTGLSSRFSGSPFSFGGGEIPFLFSFSCSAFLCICVLFFFVFFFCRVSCVFFQHYGGANKVLELSYPFGCGGFSSQYHRRRSSV